MSETVAISTANTVVLSTEVAAPVIVRDSDTITVEVGAPIVVLSGVMGPPGTTELNKLQDVEVSALQDGCMLVYRASTQTWGATKTLDYQIIDGGQY